jgi:hypothetical protein
LPAVRSLIDNASAISRSDMPTAKWRKTSVVAELMAARQCVLAVPNGLVVVSLDRTADGLHRPECAADGEDREAAEEDLLEDIHQQEQALAKALR